MADEQPKWFDGLEDVDKGVIQNKNWHELAPADAAKAAFVYGRDLEKKLGLPADQVLRIPAPDDAAGWKPVLKHLGVPDTAEGYDFTSVKNADGSTVDPAFMNLMRETAAKFNLPVKAATGVAEAILRFSETAEANEKTADMVEVQKQKDALAANWGGNAETFKFIADRAAAMMGISAEELNAIASSSNYATVMGALLKIGQKSGEAALLLDNGGGGPRAMTRDQAAARLDDIQSGRDPEFYKKWRAGDKAAVDEFNYLNHTIVGARP
jgi:hypothetical protein